MQLAQKEDKRKKFEYLDIRFFEPTEIISNDMCQILNTKLKEVKDLYERSLKRIDDNNRKLNAQIDIYQRLEKDGNVGVKFVEMSAEQVVRKLKIICKESREIWKAFDTHFGYGFFFDVLESEFGITPETRDTLIKRFNAEINKFKNAASTQITSITSKTHSELERLRKELEERNLELSLLKSKHLIEIDRVKSDIEGAMDVKLQAQLVKQFRIFDNEKQEIYAQLRELELAAGDFKQAKRDFDLRSAMTKWLFVAKIRTIRMLGDMNQKAEMATQAEKTINERELSLFLHRNPHIDLREEIVEMKSEIVELCQRISDISYECYVISLF